MVNMVTRPSVPLSHCQVDRYRLLIGDRGGQYGHPIECTFVTLSGGKVSSLDWISRWSIRSPDRVYLCNIVR